MLVAILPACSMHPIPDDATRVSTVDIVRSIRCEALAGIDSLRPEERARAEPIIKASVIGYEFRFTMSERNALNDGKAGSSLLTFKNGSAFTGDATGSASLSRANVRRFSIIESLGELRSKQNRDSCADRAVRKNLAYPVAGRIGMDEVVRTYVRLEMLSELQGEQSHPVESSGTFTRDGKHVVFADNITFTTTVDAAVDGALVLAAAAGFQLTEAALKADASRMDTHQVIVALTRKEVDVVERSRRRFAQSRRYARAYADRQDILAEDKALDPRTQALLIQVDEAARTRVAMELHRRRSLDDPENAPAEALGQRFLDLLKLP
ncbi:MAG: hypothetical protein NW223_14875 [Hyphomicrobiaceae bacterium]|nr:hypothetical protein [Hyphomicrobiaceae bacterium]